MSRAPLDVHPEQPDAESRADLSGAPARWVDAVEDWTTWARAAGRSERTIRLYRYYLARLARLHRDPWRVTDRDLLAFQGHDGWEPETRCSARKAARAFYSWAAADGRVRKDPAALLPTVRVPPSKPKPAPAAVVDGALATPDARTRLMVLLARLAGLRRAEIAGLHVDHVQVDHLRIRGKGGRTRVVPLHPDLEAALGPFVAAGRERGDGWIFPSMQARGLLPPRPTGRHLTPAHAGKLITGALAAGWTPHTLRHAAATAWYGASGHDLFAVQQLLGHSKPETTARYCALPDDALRTAVMGG